MKSRPRGSSSELGQVVRYGSDGDALVRLRSGVEAWARGVVPGDEGEFSVHRTGKRVDATLLRLVGKSAHRTEPACELVERCGGCPWMIADPVFAREQKRLSVARAIDDTSVEVEMRPSASETGYRRRARLAFDARGKGARIGYRPARSDAVLDVPRCIVLEPVLSDALTVIRENVAQGLTGKGELRLALGANARPVLTLRAEEPQPSALYASMQALVDERGFAGAALFVAGSNRPAIWGDSAERTPAIDGGVLDGTVDGFSQANDAVAVEMAKAVRDCAEPAGMRVLELYAGHGHLSIGLAVGARAFVAVEQAAEAADALRRNLAARGLSGSVITADAAHAPRDARDVVVLDPPRTGAEDAIAVVLAARPRRVVMASCDPRTLGRDLRKLVAGGYRVTRAIAFDMFPGTAHVESVVRLDRA